MAIKVRGIDKLLLEIKKVSKESKTAAENEVKRSLLVKLRETTPIDTGEAAAGWRIEGKAVVNDVDHVLQLNRGSSRQAPSNFIEKTVMSDSRLRPNGVVVSEKL